MGPNQPRVLACLPVYSGVHPAPLWHFMQMQRQWTLAEAAGVYRVHLICPGPRMKIQTARNLAVEVALNSGATHILWLDDDFICPADTLLRLLVHDADIVGPLFFRADGDYAPLIFKWRNKGDQWGLNLWTVDSWEPNTLMEVDAIGTGCLLIKTDVFRKVGPPYFYYPEATQERSMDVHFCVRAKKRGCRIYCDTSIECKQMAPPKAVGSSEFLEARAKINGGKSHGEKQELLVTQVPA